MSVFKLKRFGNALIAVIVVVFICALAISGHTWAQQQQQKQKFLADRHKDRAMECSACHKESPPQKAVPSEVCKGCHDEEKLAMKSAEKFGRQNPHDNHLGAIGCEQCHHAHKPSVDACAKCHQYGFKVP